MKTVLQGKLQEGCAWTCGNEFDMANNVDLMLYLWEQEVDIWTWRGTVVNKRKETDLRDGSVKKIYKLW